jgi:hypothetical protein
MHNPGCFNSIYFQIALPKPSQIEMIDHYSQPFFSGKLLACNVWRPDIECGKSGLDARKEQTKVRPILNK